MLSCATTGWVKKDKKTNTGTYVDRNGSYYFGGYVGKIKNGNGTFVYGFNDFTQRGGYKTYGGDNAPGLKNCSYTGVFENDWLKNNSHIIFNCGLKDDGKSDSFIYEGNYAYKENKTRGGFEGKGIVHFNDGRTLEGNFSNESTIYSTYYCCVYYELKTTWYEDNMIGSKISGTCKMTWPNGTIFIGTIYDYYLFDRRSVYFDAWFPPSNFYGIGVLKVPGHKDYEGLVGESNDRKTVTPITKEKMINYISHLESFSYEIQKARNATEGRESKAASEGQQAQKEASDWLRNEMANLPNKLNTQLAEYDAGSRGTTVAAENTKAKRQAAFNAIVEQNLNSNSSPNSSNSGNSSSGNTSSGKSSDNGSKSSNSSSEPIKEKFYDAVLNEKSNGWGKTEATACEAAEKFTKNWIPFEAYKQIKDISSCKCKDLSAESNYPNFICTVTYSLVYHCTIPPGKSGPTNTIAK